MLTVFFRKLKLLLFLSRDRVTSFCTANIFNVIFTLFKCVPLSTVISLYCKVYTFYMYISRFHCNFTVYICSAYIPILHYLSSKSIGLKSFMRKLSCPFLSNRFLDTLDTGHGLVPTCPLVSPKSEHIRWSDGRTAGLLRTSQVLLKCHMEFRAPPISNTQPILF